METMDSIAQQKGDTLLKKFEDLGYDLEHQLSQEEILSFLNKNSKSGFDQKFSSKLFQVLGLDESKTITVEDFISYYIQFEDDLEQNNIELKNKITNEQNNLSIYQEEAHKYKDEKLNEEGFCENAKLNIEISDIEIKKSLTDVNSVFLYLIYNNQKAEFNFTYSKNIKQFTDKIFEFKSVSKKDHFKLILKYTKNNSDDFYDLSKKVFPLEEITTQDEYGVQITLPEEKNQDQVVAFINAKITLHWSDYKFYLDKVKNSEIRIHKLNEALFKVNQYLSQINELYKNNTSNPILRNKGNNIVTENTQSGLGQINHMDSAFSSERLKGSADNIKNIKTKNDDDLIIKMNEDIENDLKEFEDLNEEKNYNKNSYKNLNAISLVKLLSLLCVLFSLFNSLQRPDYFSALIGIVTFGYIFFIENKNFAVKSKNFWYLFLLVFAGFIFDCFWILVNLDLLETDIDYKGPFHNAIAKICFFTNGLGGINKCCLAILLFIQYKLNY
jgi:hypothetical protein